MLRRDFVRLSLCTGATIAIAPRAVAAMGAPIPMAVYLSPTCGCCLEWVTHVEANGFAVKVIEMDDVVPVMLDSGIPKRLHSCHVALVGKYVVGGHVPADLIQKMLAEKAGFHGIAVGGMPQGSPGMEQGQAKESYEVIAFSRNGTTSVYARR